MSLWGMADNANNVPKNVAQDVPGRKKAPTQENANALYGNITATGIFAYNAAEVAASRGAVAHTGWVRRTVGSGGRAGRVQTEILVAGGITGASANNGIPSATIVISIQPATKSVNTGLATTFSVGAVTIPSGGTLSYQWQSNTGAGFANLSNAGVYSNVTTSTLSISNVAGANNYQFRVVVSDNPDGATPVTSSAAVLTVV